MRDSKLAIVRLVLISGCLLLPGAGSAQAIEPGLPSEAAVAEALNSTPMVQAAQARTHAARAEADALKAGPQEFTLTSSYLSRRVRGEGLGSDGRFDEFDAQITRAVRLPGKARIDARIGASGIIVADNRAEDARHQAALILSQSWWDWLGAAGQARIDAQAVNNYEVLLAAVKRRAELRDAAVLEVDQAQAALAMAEAMAKRSAGNVRLAHARLAARFPDLALDTEAPEIPRPDGKTFDLAALHSRILGRSHEIIAAEAEAARLAAVADRARRDRIPDPTLGLRVFSERSGNEKGIGLLVGIPFGGSHRTALMRKASAEANAAQAEAAASRAVVQEVADADLAEAQTSLAAWATARNALESQTAALNKLRRGRQAGEFQLSDVLLAERQVHDAFRAEAQARADAMRAITRIRIDAHELWIADTH